MRRWKKGLVLVLAAVFSIGFIQDLGMIDAADNTEQTEITAETGNLEEASEIETSETETEEKESEDKEKNGVHSKFQKKGLKLKESNSSTAKKKLVNGQTLLDVSKGDIVIKETGAAGGGLAEDETELNPEGYRITGTTEDYNVTVNPGVTTKLTLDNVDITCAKQTAGATTNTKLDCINVSHANVTMLLMGKNRLICYAGDLEDNEAYDSGNALAKDGMDGELTIKCQKAGQKGHICDDGCGSLYAEGNRDLFHAGAIGSTRRNAKNSLEAGFANFTIEGGNIEAVGGKHSPGLGGACCTTKDTGKLVKNIRITGGNVKTKGNEYCAGLGAGFHCEVDGLYITGGIVEAEGGENAPGIGSIEYPSKNIIISGGDTVVTAIGDKSTGKPGIGTSTSTTTNVVAVPDPGYQGYIQDGTGLKPEEYTFTAESPFQVSTSIVVGKYYTKVYFGPHRDENLVDNDTKEQAGANHIISKSGGEVFTENQLKILSKVTGKKQDGTEYLLDELSVADKTQMEAINKAKTKGETGEFPLTFQTSAGTQVTIKVYLKEQGSDGVECDPLNPSSVIGADNFVKETGGTEWTEDDVKQFAGLKGKDSEGNDIALDDFSLDQGQLDEINKTKTAGKAGEFDLKFTDPEGNSVVVKVTLTGEFDQITENPSNHEIIKAQNVISKTGGKGFTAEQLKELSFIKIVDQAGNEIPKDKLTLSEDDQLDRINKAKESGKTGEFPLTFTTENGTEVTVKIFLRDEGTDGSVHGNDSASIAANHAAHKTGGNEFSKEEIITLCDVKGKNQYGDTMPVNADEKQLEAINRAKQAGHTGVFPMTFSMSDGTSVTVNVTLTGEHKVTFDSNGGKGQPEAQTVIGGEKIKKPADPVRDGYTFEGWYYTDEDGKEKKWNFDDPLHQGIELKAKWKKNSETSKNTEADKPKNETKSTSKKKTEKEEELPEWGQYEMKGSGNEDGSRSENAAQTSDSKVPTPTLIVLAASGSISFYLLRRNYNRRR
ncbi:InlB B-repeat-containing protein [Anaerostipes sp.]|uniref:InlB B-repeat-containing protein n=1 Tax=Anaerostipes sp. TaxID=1872530 RepID=UPI0030701F2D|nr:InlB B-repeat-containing protein [Anaerostipes sp.]